MLLEDVSGAAPRLQRAEALQSLPTEVSFEAAIARLAREAKISASVNGTAHRDLYSPVRASLDSLLAEEKSLKQGGGFGYNPRPVAALSEGNAPAAFREGGKAAQPTAADLTAQLANVMFLSSKIHLVHQGVSGFRKVWDSLSRGQ